MHAKIITFAASALFVLGNAVPLNNGKRDIVWVTEVETAYETVGVTQTVWVDPTPTAKAHANNHRHKHSSSSQAPVEVKPTPSPASSSSSEEAPVAPSSYEAPSSYVAPEPTTTSTPAPSTTAQAEQTTQAAVTPESTYVAPVSSYEAPSSTYVAPVSSYEAPSTTYEAPSSTSSAAAAPSSYSSGSSSGDSSNPASGSTYTGELTYFTPGVGACGKPSGEGDDMVAISMQLFDKYTPNGNPNLNPLCGKTVTITGKDGKAHSATIMDRCVGCEEADLDMPQEFFDTVTKDPETGKVGDGRVYGYKWEIN